MDYGVTFHYCLPKKIHQLTNMRIIILLTAASVASAARLGNVHLPSHSASSGGANAGLQTPFESRRSRADQSYAASEPEEKKHKHAEIIKLEHEMNDDGYYYAYESSDGTKAEQKGHIIKGEKPEEGSLKVSGWFSYIGDDGQNYAVHYTAGEDGYQPSGDHLPTSPPIPEETANAVKHGSEENKYDSMKSSYEADAGY